MPWDKSGSPQSMVTASAVPGLEVPRGHLPGRLPALKGSCQETPDLGWRPSSSPAGGGPHFTSPSENQRLQTTVPLLSKVHQSLHVPSNQ